MNLVFSQFIFSLFCISHSLTLLSSREIRLAIFSESALLNLHDRVLSSAYNVNLKNGLQLGKSLMNIRKRRGPKIDPCGTP